MRSVRTIPARRAVRIERIYVTPGDVRRIVAHTGLAGFFRFDPPSDPRYAEQDDDPLWSRCVFRADGSRRVLRRVEEGKCMFLGPAGCLLPLDVRPLVCRLYPYAYTEAGLHDELEPSCPDFLLKPGENLIARLGMFPEEARAWHRQLYEEIRLERPSLLAQARAGGEGAGCANPGRTQIAG